MISVQSRGRWISERWVVAFFTFAGICVWVLDALIDSVAFSHGSFPDLMFNANTHEFYFRFLFLASFIAAGILISGLMASRRKDAEKLERTLDQLEHEKSKVAAIVESISDGISIQGPDFRVLYQNRIHEDFTGGNKVGQLCYKAYSGNDSVCPDCPVEKVFKDGRVHSVEKRKDYPNGITHLEIVASPLRDSSGKVVAGIEMVRDISYRKEAERKQREAYNHLETLLEAIPYAAFFKDAEGRHVVANEATCRFIGLNRDEIVGRTAKDILPPEIAEVCHSSDNAVLESKKMARMEETFPDGQGNSLIFETIKTPLFDEDGNIQGLVGISYEITERKKTEKAIRELNERYQRVVDDLPDLICRYRPDTTITFVNKAYAEYFGKTVPELVGTSFLDLIPSEHHDYIRSKIKSLGNGSPVAVIEHKAISPDGKHRWQLWRDHALFDGSGEVVEVQSIGQDITERKEAEEQLRQYQEHLENMVRDRTAELTTAIELLQEQIQEGRKSEMFIKNILESIDESLIVLDPEYRIVSANRAFCEQSFLSPEEVKGKHCYELLHSRLHPCFVAGENCSARRVLVSGEPASSMHAHYRGENSIFVETKSYPMRDSGGKITSVIQVINDITEKRRLEEQLRHSQKMEAIGQLAGGVAHDFNNRLAAIINYAYILKTKLGPDDPLSVHVSQILNSSERAAHLTQNLLTFSRKHVIDPRPIRLNDIVAHVEKLLTRVIGEDIELSTELSSDELVVMADGDQMEHVLINLATNARDAMPGSGQVKIRTARVELGKQFFEGRSSSRPGSYAMILFRDSGTGMSRETREKVFEPFFTTKAIGKGTGLGLSIVYGIVRQHNGYITVDSEPGKGTSFSVYLPLLTTRAQQAESEEEPPPERGSETVLLVEDDEDVRRPLKQMLEGYGYEVIEAVNGKDAVEKFLQSRKTIGLLVLDVILPGLNGVEVLEEIRKVEPGIKAIFTSGYSEEHIRTKGFLATGSDFLSKPVLPEVLLKKVREALDR